MEGLIPFVYRAIVQYKNGAGGGGQGSIGTWFGHESPSASYIRLPGDSGRFQTSDIQLFRPEYGFAPASSASRTPSSTTQIIVSTGVQSPVRRFASRRMVA